MTHFSIILPTRKRVKSVERLMNSIIDTVSDKNTFEMCVYVDDDDDDTLNYVKKEGRIKYKVGPRITLSKMWNECYEELSTGEIIMHCGDDIIFRSKDWDVLVKDAIDKYDDKILLVYGMDGIQNENMATHSFVHRKWIEASGFWLPPYFSSDYNDLWLDNVARDIHRIKYIPEIYTEHMHFTVGKSEIDSNTTDRLHRHNKDNVAGIWTSTQNERNQHAEKLTLCINADIIKK
jgi:glycosyltransferase involved in cell wall biosynthesis